MIFIPVDPRRQRTQDRPFHQRQNSNTKYRCVFTYNYCFTTSNTLTIILTIDLQTESKWDKY